MDNSASLARPQSDLVIGSDNRGQISKLLFNMSFHHFIRKRIGISAEWYADANPP